MTLSIWFCVFALIAAFAFGWIGRTFAFMHRYKGDLARAQSEAYMLERIRADDAIATARMRIGGNKGLQIIAARRKERERVLSAVRTVHGDFVADAVDDQLRTDARKEAA